MAAPLVLSDKLLELPLEGRRLPAANLRGILNHQSLVWLQFLRHLGCLYCKGLVEDIRHFLRDWNNGITPYLVFIHPNTLEEGETFFARYYPEVPHVADPQLRLYQAFRVRRASWSGLLSPANLTRFWTLFRRGHRNDRPTTDPLVLHASFLFYQNNLIWTHYARSLGEVPQWPREV